MVVIRLARYGRKNSPVYQITVADKKARLNGKFIERIGDFNPSLKGEKNFVINSERYDFWMKQGAEPSPRLVKLIDDNKVASKKAAK